jgi:hypothetical protein
MMQALQGKKREKRKEKKEKTDGRQFKLHEQLDLEQDMHGQGRLLELRVRAFCAALEQPHHLLFPVHRRVLFTLLFSTQGQSIKELQGQNHKSHSSSSQPCLTAVRIFEEISKSLMHAAAVHALLLQVPI